MPQKPKSNSFKKILLTLFILLIMLVLTGGGYYLGTQHQVRESTKVISTSPAIPSPTPIITTNWKTYSSATFGFSIKYPSDWTTLNRVPNTISLNKAGDSGVLDAVVPPGYPNDPSGVLYGGVFFQIFKVDPTQSLTDWATAQNISYQPTTANGYQAIQTNFIQTQSAASKEKQTSPLPVGYKARYVYFKNNDIIISLQASGNIKNPDVDLKLFDQMLATFTFTTPPGWKTYTGSDFSFSYPNTWITPKNSSNNPPYIYFVDPSSGSNTGNGGGLIYGQFIQLSLHKTTQTVDQYITTVKNNQITALVSDFKTKTITLIGQTAQAYYQEGEGTVGWYIPLSNGNEIVDFGPLSIDPSQDSTELQIVKTFTFAK